MTEPKQDTTQTRADQMFTWDRDEAGVVVVTFDDPDSTVNIFNARFTAALRIMTERLQAEAENITGVVITSGKSSFSAGEDLGLIREATGADRDPLRQSVLEAQHILRQLECLGIPVVALLNGTALGSGFELALACHHRIAISNSEARFGLPQVSFGIIPGAGGTTRVVRMLGPVSALENVLLPGREFNETEALELGLLDAVVTGRETALSQAREWIAANRDVTQPWDHPGFQLPGGDPTVGSVAAALRSIGARHLRSSRGSRDAAGMAVIACVVDAANMDLASSLRADAEYYVSLACNQESTNLIKSRFFDIRALRRGASRPNLGPTTPASRIAVLGSGMMGAGIALVSLKAGIEVLLKDIDRQRAEEGRASIARRLGAGHEQVLEGLHIVTNDEEVSEVDLVVEAVFENPDVKIAAINAVEPYTKGAVLASNTSTLPITRLGRGTARPEDFIGLHFFSPVEKMELVEIVVGADTSDETLARAFDFCQSIDKTPIVVNDARGFFTSRVITQFMNESLALIGEGTAAASVEQAALQAGYPTGGLALFDEISLELMRNIREESASGLRAEGRDRQSHPGDAVLDRMLDGFGRKGRRGGAGFYEYQDDRRVGLWTGLAEAFGPMTIPVDLTEAQERMLFAEALEAVRCLEEGVLRTVIDGNVGSLLGIGFPRWTGGVFQYINQYADGPAGFLRRANQLAVRHGSRFSSPKLLLDVVSQGRIFE